MAAYSNEYSEFKGRDYASKTWNRTFKDPDDSVQSIIKAVRDAIAIGNYAGAKAIIEQNKELIEPYIINAEAINAISEEIHNLEVFAQEAQNAIFYQETMPDAVMAGNVWISSAEV